jgi:hypothetical protein
LYKWQVFTKKEVFLMKKSKLLILGAIALLLVGGLVVVGCGPLPNNNCPTYDKNPKCGYTYPISNEDDKDCLNGCIRRQYYDLPGGPSSYTKINLTCQCHSS